jgi:hypothetical protein
MLRREELVGGRGGTNITRQTLKHVVETLFGQDAVKDFDDEPFRSGRLGKMLDTLWFFGYYMSLRGLG